MRAASAITPHRFAGGLALAALGCSPASETRPAKVVDADFVVGEPADQGALQLDHTCLGRDRSPRLSWEAAALPASASHIAVRVRSRDGVVWLAWDAPVTDNHLPAAILGPTAPPTQGTNHRGRVGWAGPCPPDKARGQMLQNSVEVEFFVTSDRIAAPPTTPAPEVVDRAQPLLVAYGIRRLDLDLR